MINVYVTYAVASSDLYVVRDDLERVLQVHFDLHDSSYWGEYFLAKLPDSQKIKIGFNYVDEDWREEEYKEYPILLELNRLKNLEEVMDKINSHFDYLIPIRKEEIESGNFVKSYIFVDGKPTLISERSLKKKGSSQ